MAAWPYNTTEWQSLRLAILRDEPFCRYCKASGDLTAGEVVDHIIPVKEDPRRAFEPENLQSLCKRCHDSHKHSEEIRGYSCQVDAADGWPVDPRHPANFSSGRGG